MSHTRTHYLYSTRIHKRSYCHDFVGQQLVKKRFTAYLWQIRNNDNTDEVLMHLNKLIRSCIRYKSHNEKLYVAIYYTLKLHMLTKSVNCAHHSIARLLLKP